jgi:simple sugar transport system substrate-binding protein
MTIHKRLLLAAGFGAGLALGVVSDAQAAPKDLNIAVIVKTLDSTFWQDLAEGAKEMAAKDGHVTVTVAAPSSEAAVEEQVSKVDNMIARHVDAIVIAAVAPVQLAPALQRAVDAGIKVVLVDTHVPDFSGQSAYVGTNNENGGKAAGEFIAKHLGGKGKVGLVNGTPGVPAVDDRIKGVRAALASTDIDVVSELAAIDCTTDKGVAAGENLLTAHPDVNAIFVACGPAAVGVNQAAKAAGVDFSKLIIVGFDAAPGELEAIKAGEETATIAQHQSAMGGEALRLAAMAARGETLPTADLDTGVVIVTKENVSQFLP